MRRSNKSDSSEASRSDGSARPGPLTIRYLARLLQESIAASTAVAVARRRANEAENNRGMRSVLLGTTAYGPRHGVRSYWMAVHDEAARCADAADERLVRAEAMLAPEILDGGVAEDIIAAQRGKGIGWDARHDTGTAVMADPYAYLATEVA